MSNKFCYYLQPIWLFCDNVSIVIPQKCPILEYNSHRCDFMRKVELRVNDQEKYDTIKELVDYKGNKNRACEKFSVIIYPLYILRMARIM